MANVHNIKEFIDRRRGLRTEATPAEEILWEKLRRKNLGMKFKRQHSVGGYILDFYCAEARLVIELDGSVHDSPEQKEYDHIRDTYFRDLDYRVLRIKNIEVESNLSEVVLKINSALEFPSP